MFSPEYEEALTYAAHRHAGQTRKGTGAAYLTHLVHVARIVRGYGYDTDHEITALLHDVLEDTCSDDAERRIVTAEIETTFGSRVAQAVEALSEPRWDADGERLSWLPRKQAYLEHLEHASALAVRVSAADKIHNLATLMAELDARGAGTWSRFRGSPEQSAWFYREVAKAVLHRIPREPIGAELQRLTAELDTRVDEASP